MARELLSDALWEEVRSVLPVRAPNPKGGRPWKSDRDALRGILFVLETGISWEYLPADLFRVSGLTCWRRLRDWGQANVWDELQRRLADRLGGEGEIDWARAVIDSTSLPANEAGRSPVTTRRTEGKRARQASSSADF